MAAPPTAQGSPQASLPKSGAQASWLYGRGVDLLIGCCGIYTLSIPLLLAYSASTGSRQWPIALTILLAMAINAPHYGATLVRLYEQKEDRQKYVFFTVHVTLAVTALFFVATRNVWLASLVITAYVTWSPWHFSAQNYGLLVMFLRRQGIAFDDTTKRLLYASFIFSTAMAIEGIQATSSDLVFAPATFRAPNMPDVIQIAFLRDYASPILWTTGALYLGCLSAALYRLRASFGAGYGPIAALIVTQALFSAIPVAGARLFTSGELSLAFAPVWLSMAHSAQYLWVSAYFAKRSNPQTSSARFLGKAFLAGSGITVLPALLFAPSLLGTRPWDAGLAGLVFAVVNLHHFIMDGAIWKLRDGRVGSVLLRSVEPSSATASQAKTSTITSRLLPIGVWTACALSVVVPLVDLYETEIAIPSASKPAHIDAALRKIRLVGRESLGLHNYVGQEYARLKQPTIAIQHFKRSLELFPTPDAWTALANEYRNINETSLARAAYDAALSIQPERLGALLGAATVRAFDPKVPTRNDIAEARELLKRAIAAHPEHHDARNMLNQLPGRPAT